MKQTLVKLSSACAKILTFYHKCLVTQSILLSRRVQNLGNYLAFAGSSVPKGVAGALS
jgi:hypothetical protein